MKEELGNGVDVLYKFTTDCSLQVFKSVSHRRHIGEVTEGRSHTENLKHLCLEHLLWARRHVDQRGSLRHLH